MASKMKYRLLVHSARQVVTVTNGGKLVLSGKEMDQIEIVEAKENTGISLVVGR